MGKTKLHQKNTIMKKNIILSAAFMLVSLHQLTAQDDGHVNPSVSKSFEQSFTGARNVTWTQLPSKIAQAKFIYGGGSWLAYFDHEGKMITSGRKIKNVNDLPLEVQSGLYKMKSRLEKKSGSLLIAYVYEMMKDGHTKYFIVTENNSTTATFSVNPEGFSVLENKKPRSIEAQVPRDVIAKKN